MSREIALQLVIAALPIFVLLFYFWFKDKGEAEPLQLMRRIFILGVLVVMPVAGVEFLLQSSLLSFFEEIPWWFWFISPFFFVALPEEFGKLWVVKKVAYYHPKFNELMDGITYTVIASMGFAMFENAMYTVQFGTQTGLLRAFTAVPAHALFSGLMGFYVGYAKAAKNPHDEKKLFRKALFIGVLFHGLYDFLLMSGYAYLMLLIFPLLMYMAAQLHFGLRLANAQRTQEELEYL